MGANRDFDLLKLAGLEDWVDNPPPPPLESAPPGPPLAELHTSIAGNKTTFRSWTPKEGYQEISIPTRVVVDRRYAASHPGAGVPYETSAIQGVSDRHAGKTPYGPAGAFIDTGDPRGRDIHGGGSGVADPFAPEQSWRATDGCTRGKNEDIERLGRAITAFQNAYPGVAIPYRRTAH